MRFIYLVFTTLFLFGFSQIDFVPTSNDLQYLIQEPTDTEVESAIPIKNIEKARTLGMILYHLDNSCASCHPISTGGQPTQDERFALGRNGDVEKMMVRHGKEIKLDQQNKKTPEVINSLFLKNALWFCEAGSGGFNEGLTKDSLLKLNPNNAYGYSGRLTQVLTAQGEDAHNISFQIEHIKDDEFFQNMAKEAFHTQEINRLVTASAIGIYEQYILPLESPYQKWLRGEGKLKYKRGYDLFKKNCVQCHSGKAFGNEQMKPMIGKSDFEGRDGLVKVPQLYQKKDAKTMFHSSEKLTVYGAMKAHDLGLTRKAMRDIRSFINYELQDKNLTRYKNY